MAAAAAAGEHARLKPSCDQAPSRCNVLHVGKGSRDGVAERIVGWAMPVPSGRLVHIKGRAEAPDDFQSELPHVVFSSLMA